MVNSNNRWNWGVDPFVIVLSLVVLLATLRACAGDPEKAPPHGWTSGVELIRVIDGDTIEVSVKRTVRVRLLNCWAPEKNQPGGPESTANLSRILTDSNLTLHVPMDSGEIEDIWTFGRVLGYVWTGDSQRISVNERQILDGHATRAKQ